MPRKSATERTKSFRNELDWNSKETYCSITFFEASNRLLSCIDFHDFKVKEL